MEPIDVTAVDKTAETPVPSLATMSSADREKFMRTGDVDIDALLAEPKSSEPASDDKTATGESGAASDAADKDAQEPPKETRFQKRYKKMEERAAAAERERDELRAKLEAKPAPSQAADKAKRPRAKDYPSIDAWEDAVEAYDDKLRADAVREAIRQEREAENQKTQQAEKDKSETKQANSLIKQIKEFRKELPVDDFDEKFIDVKDFLNEKQAMHVADALVESEKGAALINYFGDHPEELEKLVELSPSAALRELVKLELSDKIKVPAPKKITDAKRIVPDVDGKGSSSDEESELLQAAANGDMKTFNKIMDLREKRELAESRR